MIEEWLNDPIPRKTTLLCIGLMGVGHAMTYLGMKQSLNQAARIYHDQEQRIAIYRESMDFLLERASDADATELNEKLDYWRVIRGIEPRDNQNPS